MRNILLSIMILLFACSAASAEDAGAGGEKLSSFGFSFGCFLPEDKNYDDIYDDDRETSYSLYYDKEFAKNRALGLKLTYYEDTGRGVSQSGTQSPVSIDLRLVKADISAIYRMKVSAGQLIVPQIKAGLTGTYFNEKIKGGKRTENVYLGYHASFSLMFLLDRLDRDNAVRLKEGYYIKDTYFVLGVDYTRSDDIKDNKIDLSGLEYHAGVIFRY